MCAMKNGTERYTNIYRNYTTKQKFYIYNPFIKPIYCTFIICPFKTFVS